MESPRGPADPRDQEAVQSPARQWLLLAVILVSVFLLYAPALERWVQGDDFSKYEWAIHYRFNLLEGENPFFRPLEHFVNAVNLSLVGPDSSVLSLGVSMVGILISTCLVFFIAGTEPSGALNRSGTSVLADIENAISAHDLAGKVQLLGHVSNDEIFTLYAAAGVFVFPLVETPGDVEGFGMVAIEAASHGTPTVAFDCGGVGDAVIDGKNGILINPGNYTKFSEATLHLLQEGSRDSARDFASHFSWEIYGTQIQSCIEKVLI